MAPLALDPARLVGPLHVMCLERQAPGARRTREANRPPRALSSHRERPPEGTKPRISGPVAPLRRGFRDTIRLGPGGSEHRTLPHRQTETLAGSRTSTGFVEPRPLLPPLQPGFSPRERRQTGRKR
jgi:hypothetical protein